MAADTRHDLPSTIRVISLNCWGLKYVSKHRQARMQEIGRQLLAASPPPQIVGLQECWTQEDFHAIRTTTQHILPYAKFYWSGFFGGGLALLSCFPIEESRMVPYSLNGRPAAFYRGDWFVGKGVACARLRIGAGVKDVIEVFNTHLHAPYEPEGQDSYLCHRTAQAWEIAKLMRHAAERGHAVLGMGDFNMLPGSLAHRLIEAHTPARDVWRLIHPNSAEGIVAATIGGGVTAQTCIDEHGTTCDSILNTWRWSKQLQKELDRGKEEKVIDPLEAKDDTARRLDYIFFADRTPSLSSSNDATSGKSGRYEVTAVHVGMTSRHPELRCSLSDHFSVETTLSLSTDTTSSAAESQATPTQSQPATRLLDRETYTEIHDLLRTYIQRERTQRKWRERNGLFLLGIVIACWIAVWWSPHNGVAFALMVASTLAGVAAFLDGLLFGFLFVKGELRALKEWGFEVEMYEAKAVSAGGRM